MVTDFNSDYKHMLKRCVWTYAQFLPYSPTWEHEGHSIRIEEDPDISQYDIRYESEDETRLLGSYMDRERAFEIATGYVECMEEGTIENILDREPDYYKSAP